MAEQKSQLQAAAEEIVILSDAIGDKGTSSLQVDLVFSLRIHRNEKMMWVAQCHSGLERASTPEAAIAKLAEAVREKLAAKIAKSRDELAKLERTLTPLRIVKKPTDPAS